VAIIGDTNGEIYWELTYSALLRTSYVTLPSGDRQTRLDYLVGFLRARRAEGNGEFVMQDPMNGKDYLARFVTTDFELQLVRTESSPMYATTTIQIEQAARRDIGTLDDGSLGDFGGDGF
jgi:hypothetical protein